MSVAAVRARETDAAARLNPQALVFVSSRSESESGSPLRCSSPEGSDLGHMGHRQQLLQESPADMFEQHQAAARVSGAEEAGTSGQRTAVIPAPAPRAGGLSRQRSASSNSLSSGCASPPHPAMLHPGMVPTYGWGAPIPVYHVYPPPPNHDGPIQRSASPPAVFPNGGSPPLPTGFISVPLHAMQDPGSPTSRHMYGASPPPFGASPPPYGSSPPGMAGSPPGMMYMPPPPGMMHPHHHHHHGGAGGEYGMAHAGYAMQHQQEFVQRMGGMSLSQPQPVAQQQPHRANSTSSTGSGGNGGGGRSEGRASARIARSHRAGGAYNPEEFEFNLEEADSGRPEARRTIMIRNIPNKYNQEMMLSVLCKSGFSGTFDFFYLPIDFRNKCNLGYCFVNFLDASTAGRLYREYHNKKWEEYNSKKVCEITYGRVQGQDTLVQHFRASKFPSDDIEFMPLVYTRVAEGVASEPVAIHQFLGGGSSSGSPTVMGAGASAVGPPGSDQPQ